MKRQDFLLILVSSVIVVFAWIIFTVIHQSVSSTINDTVTSQIAPIQPTFDTKTIDALKKRQLISPDFTLQATPSAGTALSVTTPTPTPIAVITPRPTIIINQQPAAQATSGGTQVP